MEIDDLKCCGNCIYRISMDMGDYFRSGCSHGKITQSFERCDKWEFDEHDKDRRTIK